jgi:hypothetical protein
MVGVFAVKVCLLGRKVLGVSFVFLVKAEIAHFCRFARRSLPQRQVVRNSESRSFQLDPQKSAMELRVLVEPKGWARVEPRPPGKEANFWRANLNPSVDSR